MTGGISPSPSSDDLFDPAFLAALEPFALRIAAAQKGGRLADQRTAARGQGTDFADFKPYVAGDDLRTIDWNIYRRLGHIFVRVFEERQDMPVYILVDASGSMSVETPPRIHAALRAAMALATVSLAQHDTVSLFSVADHLTVQARSLSGKANIARVARHLADHGRQGGTELAASIDRLAAMKLRRGLVIIVSDFFTGTGIGPVIDSMARLPHRLLLVQMIKAHDADPALDPDLNGEVIVDDGEGAMARLAITPDMIARYRTAYRAYDDALTGFAASHRAGLARIDADRPVLEQLTALFGGGTMAL